MPLRFPKTLYQNWQAGMEQIVTLDGRSFVFETRQGVHFFNPARYSEIRKITFWMLVTMNTTDFSGTATAFRHRLAAVSDGLSDKVLRQTTLAAGGQVQTPDGSNFALGFGNATSTINANNLYGNNGNASFQSLQPAPTAGNQSFGLFQQTFDRFTAGDQELFDRLLGVQDPDQWVAFIPALEGNGTITTGQSQIQIRSIGYTVTQAPSPNNKTVTYIPISWGRDNSSTGPTDFNENDAQSQIGGNSFRYVEDDWDGITGMKLLVNFANRLNTSGITVRANKVNSLSAKTTDQLLTDTIAGHTRKLVRRVPQRRLLRPGLGRRPDLLRLQPHRQPWHGQRPVRRVLGVPGDRPGELLSDDDDLLGVHPPPVRVQPVDDLDEQPRLLERDAVRPAVLPRLPRQPLLPEVRLRRCSRGYRRS
jgi:hypothetical protein